MKKTNTKQSKKQSKPTAKNKSNRGSSTSKKQTNIIKDNRVIGNLEVSKSGMGFMVVPGMDVDIRINPLNFNTAIHGDTVEVEVFKIGKSTRRPEAAVIRIIERNLTQVIGRLQLNEKVAFLIPNNESIQTDFYIPLDKLKGAKNGDKVIANNLVFAKNRKNPMAEVLEIITADKENDFAMQDILLGEGFPLTFSKGALKELESIQEIISAEEVAKRKDFRKTFTFTIDPTDAKDFDDAISYRLIKPNLYEVGIHIADVSHYVQPNTALDADAYMRSTSVYLPDRVNPMLPEKISNELCSLRPNEDKLTFSAVFEMNGEGEILSTWIGRTIIHSARRYTYDEAQKIIEGGEDKHKEIILLLNDVTQKIRAKRFSVGAINFSSQEVRFVLDEKAVPIAVTLKTSKEANQLIEELMLAANKAVAQFAGKQQYKGAAVPFPYRVHDAPDPDKILSFTQFAGNYGYRFNLSSAETLAKDFNKMLAASQGKPERTVLETLGIRTMANAAYTTTNIGHYGLAFADYCHFTSPIRRYPDVLVHRIVQQCLDKNFVIDKELEEKCTYTSAQERRAMTCERDSNKYKQVEFMSHRLGEKYRGVISGVTHFGFWVETIEHKCEGLVSVKNLLAYDVFAFQPDQYCLIGQRTKTKFTIGDEVEIIVAAANLDQRQLDFELVLKAAPLEMKTSKKKKK
jgi:ribonuclease R